MTTNDMSFNQALRHAINQLLESLETATQAFDQLKPGDVWSLLQDVCIDAHISVQALPRELSRLYLEAKARGNNHPVNYHLDAMIRTVRSALERIPSS